jgi:hypothetical protein
MSEEEKKMAYASAKATAKEKKASTLKRGMFFWIVDTAGVKRAARVAHIGSRDGTTNDKTTIHYQFVTPDGSFGNTDYVSPWVLDRRFESGEAGLIDGATAKIVVTLPSAWQAQAAKHEAAVAEAAKSRAWVTNEREPITHPSYGVVTLCRSSGHQRLYGTPFEHYAMMTLEISRAVDVRSLSGSRPHAAEHLIEIRLSEAQFARMITSVGNGEGTACTLAYVNGEAMPPPPGVDEVEEFHDDVKRTVKAGAQHVTDAIAAARAAIQRSKLSGKASAEILAALAQVEKTYADAIPFTVKQFHERMDEIVLEGKTEIDAYLQMKGTGAAALTAGEVPVALPAPKGEKSDG